METQSIKITSTAMAKIDKIKEERHAIGFCASRTSVATDLILINKWENVDKKVLFLINEYTESIEKSESPAARVTYEKVIADLNALLRSIDNED